MKTLKETLRLFKAGHLSQEETEYIISSLNYENEIGVSDSPTKNGALPLVRKRNANDKTDNITSESEHGTLGKRTETKEFKPCNFCDMVYDENDVFIRYKCDGRSCV